MLLFLSSLLSFVNSQTDECPTGWVSYEFSCYKFIRSTPKGRLDAKVACMNYNAQLLSINTMEEHSFITDWLRQYDPQHKTWYTSGIDTGVNVWRWEGDDTLISNLDQAFLPGQELDVDNKIAAYNYSEYANRWGFLKVNGVQEHPYICEIAKSMLHLIIINERGLDYGLIIKDKRKLPRGPKIIKEPQPAIFDTSVRTETNDITLRCVADAYPPPKYEWFKEEYENNQLKLILVDPMADNRVTITDGSLTIYNPNQIQDRGKYHCRAANKFGTAVSQSVQLAFGYIYQFNLVRSNEQGKENWGKAIYCDPPQHFPGVHYYWARDNFPNLVDEDKRTFVSQDGNLYFSALQNIDNGMYSCNVQSFVSSTGRTGPVFRLEVISQPSSQQLLFPNNFPKSFPEAPLAGEDVRLECMAFGYPIPSYNWTRRGYSNELPAQAVTASYNRVLILPKVTVEDMGEYICTSSNGKSSVSKAVTLSVQAKPVFTIPLEDMHMDYNGYLYWMCEAFGIPAVEYEWLKNGEPLNEQRLVSTDREFITVRKNVLTIRDLRPDRDEGVYQCRATNQLGTTYSTGQLRVLSLKPSFAKYPLEAETYAIEGGNVTIACRPEAAPLPHFIWRKDGQVISPTARRRILVNGYLLIQPVTREDQGRYRCTAENTYGSDSSEGLLRVLRLPQIRHSPSANIVAVNGTLNLLCEATSDEGLDLTYAWYHNGLRIDTSMEHQFETGWTAGVLYGYNMTFADSGMYECVAKTPVSRVAARAPVFVRGPPGPPGGVQILSARDKDIRLTWSDGADNGDRITGYRIEGHTQWAPNWVVLMDDVFAQNIEFGRKSAVVNGNLLSPWCSYEFRIIAKNTVGLGEPSEPSPQHSTEPDKPYAYPLHVGGGGGKVGDLTITWLPLPAQEQNADGIYYRVYFKPADSDRDFRIVDLKDRGNVRMHVVRVSQRNFYTLYKVRVQAVNSKGEGPISPLAEIFSAENLPLAVPTQVSSLPFNSTALRVSWLPLDLSRESIRGKLIGFRLRYWRADSSPDTSLYYLSRYTENTALIVGLQPFTYYSVAVSAFNDAGAGPESEFFTEKTYKSAPLKAPTSDVVVITSPTTVRVTWRFTAPSSQEEPIQGYKVRYWEADQDFSTFTDVVVNIGASKLEAEVTNLTPGKVYKLRVLAYSLGGDGRMSSPAWQFKMGGMAPGQSYAYSSAPICNLCLLMVTILSGFTLLMNLIS